MTRYAIVSNGLVVNVATGDAEWAAPVGAVQSDVAQIGWAYDGKVFTDPTPPPEPPPARTRYVRKLLILDRLSDAGLFDAAFAALGGPGEVGYERWQAAAEIAADDAQVRGLLAAIGAGPDVILAPE